MSKNNFAEQIDYLIFTGAIQGDSIMTLCNLLKSYEQGLLSAAEVQHEINSFNPDYLLQIRQED